MNHLPSFWLAFEASTRVILMVIGWSAPWLIAMALLIAAVEWRKIVKLWRGR